MRPLSPEGLATTRSADYLTASLQAYLCVVWAVAMGFGAHWDGHPRFGVTARGQ
jgi:hypothetical protein